MAREARAMVVTNGIERAVQYFTAAEEPVPRDRGVLGRARLRRWQDDGVVAERVPSSEIAERIQEEPYRFLICADKFQTGYDEPLPQTMYGDKGPLGIKTVQTLSAQSRASRPTSGATSTSTSSSTSSAATSSAELMRGLPRSSFYPSMELFRKGASTP
jgi:type I restriction enzyme, R subunit